MRIISVITLPCLLGAQGAAQTPLTFEDIQASARSAPELVRVEARLAEERLQLQDTRSFLREGPTVSVEAGPRRTPGLPGTTDKSLEVELPLFLSPRARADVERALGQAHPLLREAARREGALRLRKAYLDAWLAARLLALREADQATVHLWLQATKAHVKAGGDPEFQLSLVEGERLKILQDLDEARSEVARTWGALVVLADLPATPVPLADPGPMPVLPQGALAGRLREGPLGQALEAQAELEARDIRLKERLAQSRWSLRGSYGTEGQDKVARLGFAVRLPRPGEQAAMRSSTEAQLRVARGEARQALADLDARIQELLARLQNATTHARIPDFTGTLATLNLRIQEGRERYAEALPIRRQILEAQMAALRRIHARHLLSAELQALLP